MPKVQKSQKAPADSWELMEPTLDKLDQTMRKAEIESHEGKKNMESLAHLKDPQAENPLNFLPLLKRKAIAENYMNIVLKVMLTKT